MGCLRGQYRAHCCTLSTLRRLLISSKSITYYYHLYADDTQLCISFNTDCCADLDEAKLRVERCVKEIDLWMCKNLLKLNQDKTELVVISSKFRNRPNLEYVRVGDEFIAPNLSVSSLGVNMDNYFCMEQHVQKICSEANYHLRKIPKIRKYLTQDSAQILIHAFITLSLTSVTHFYMIFKNT